MTTVSIPEGITKIGYYGFSSAKLEGHLVLPDSVTRIGFAAFSHCESLKSVRFGKDLNNIDTSAFSGCVTLETVQFPPTSSSLSIHNRAFSKCFSLRELVLPFGAKYLDDYAFAGCTSLLHVGIPDSVTHIGIGAFTECVKLRTMNWPQGTRQISDLTFAFSTSLGHMYLPNVTQIGNGAFTVSGIPSIFINTPDSANLSLYQGVFSYNPKLLNVTVNVTEKVVVNDGFMANSHNAKVYFRRDVQRIEDSNSFPDGSTRWMMGYTCDPQKKQCNCAQGYGDYLNDTDPTFVSCVPCDIGHTSDGNSMLCQPCEVGKYAASAGALECTPCPKGKASGNTTTGAISSDVCVACRPGEYAPATGSSSCVPCPPGSYCNDDGMDMYIDCAPGRYTPLKSQTQCKLCPRGAYQPELGLAFCKLCPNGTASMATGSTASAACSPCRPGRYSTSKGSKSCSQCPKGQYQAQSGQDQCEQCGRRDTNNANHTACVVNSDLVVNDRGDEGPSLVELLFSDGDPIGWYLLLVAVALFMSVGIIMTYFRERNTDKLVGFTRLKALYFSFMPGFNFGSSMVLLLASLADGYYAVFLWLLLARLLHVLGASLVLMLLFSDEDSSLYHTKLMVKLRLTFPRLRATMDETFPLNNMQSVEAVAFLCLMDVGMISFLPWKKEVSRFFDLSEGFPSYPLMTYCLMVNTFSTVIIVACEIDYLAVSSPTGSAESLFIMNIVFGIVSVVMAALVLGLRRHILKNIDEGEGGEDKESKGGEEGGVCKGEDAHSGDNGTAAIELPENGLPDASNVASTADSAEEVRGPASIDAEQPSRSDSITATIPSFGAVYPRSNSIIVPPAAGFMNPLHSASRTGSITNVSSITDEHSQGMTNNPLCSMEEGQERSRRMR